jgi:hypothetical protein
MLNLGAWESSIATIFLRTYFKTFIAPVCHFERSEEYGLSHNIDPSLALRVTQ